jgi:hypothetical protein
MELSGFSHTFPACESSVDAFIEALQQTSDWYPENFADPEQGGYSDWPPSFNLLPVSRGTGSDLRIFRDPVDFAGSR